MILDAFGPDASALLVAGALGGLTRGMIVLRAKAAAGPLTATVITSLAIDISTSIVIGSMSSLFLSNVAMGLLGPALDMLHLDPAPKVITSGFVAGLGGITLIGTVLDFIDIRSKLKSQQAAQQAPDPTIGGKP